MFVPIIPSAAIAIHNNSYQEYLNRQRLQSLEQENDELRSKVEQLDEENNRHKIAIDRINGIVSYNENRIDWFRRVGVFSMMNIELDKSIVNTFNNRIDHIYNELEGDFFHAITLIDLDEFSTTYNKKTYNRSNCNELMDDMINDKIGTLYLDIVCQDEPFIECLKVSIRNAIRSELEKSLYDWVTLKIGRSL